MHSLSHLALDSFRFGNLDIFSCFPFESFLQYIKKLPTKVNMQFEQVIKKIIERDEILECDYLKDTNEIVLCNSMDEINCFRIATFKDFLIKCNTYSDGVGFLQNNTPFFIEYFKMIHGKQYFFGKSFVDISPFLSYQFSNQIFNYFKCKKLSDFTISYSIEAIKCKGVCFLNSSSDEYVIMPLMNTDLEFDT